MNSNEENFRDENYRRRRGRGHRHDRHHGHRHDGWYRGRGGKGRWIKFPLIVTAIILIKSAIIFFLWNELIPDLFHAPMLTYLQAVELTALVKLLVGGGRGHFGRHHHFGHFDHREEHFEREEHFPSSATTTEPKTP
jgi:hypothetical protein